MSEKSFDQHFVSMSRPSGAPDLSGDIGGRTGDTSASEPKRLQIPPLWKVGRELYRIVDKANSRLPFAYMRDLVQQIRHDQHVPEVLQETVGNLPFTRRIAVFILYQPNGIAASTFFTLDHLARSGWSVVVVANMDLSPDDRTELAARSAQVIQRPNIGYDFGAYREGWRWLERHGHNPERLILMNDSTWFPLRSDDDSLARMEALDADLTGHVFKTEKTEDRGRDHIESHLLMFGPRALGHPAMREFMRRYVMSSSKAATIRRGEKGISQAAIAAGLQVKALFGREEMVELFSGLSDENLLLAVGKLALHNDAGRKQRDAWLSAAAAGRPWRNDVLGWIHRELSNSRQHLVGATFVDPAMTFGGMAYLKKHDEPRFQLARMAVMRGLQEGRIAPLEPIILEEIEATIRSWKHPVSWRDNPNEVKAAPRL